MRWGVPKQKRHCAAYGGISHQVIIIQKQKDFVIDVGQVIYQHRTIVCAWTREVSSIRPICAPPAAKGVFRVRTDEPATRTTQYPTRREWA